MHFYEVSSGPYAKSQRMIIQDEGRLVFDSYFKRYVVVDLFICQPLIERSPNINFQEIISDRIWVHETQPAINEELKFWSKHGLTVQPKCTRC